jgi:hypothetical protein
MMIRVELHEEVVKFLESTGTVRIENGKDKSYIVNNSWYKPTDEKGVFTVQFITAQYPKQ